MLSGVVKLSNLQCSTICDNVCWTMLKGYVKLTYICWTTNQIYIAIICSQFFIRKDSSVGSTLARFINQRSQVRIPGSPLDRVFLPFSVWWYSACLRFLYFFSLFKLVFSTWGGLDIYSTFHANFCSFLFFHEFESTDISTLQQLPARGRHVHSFLSATSAATQFARLW